MSPGGLVLRSRPLKGGGGFTLLELLLVIAVLAILAGLLFGMLRVVEAARYSTTESRILSLRLEVRRQIMLKGVPPARLEDLAPALDKPGWMEGGRFVDGWNRPLEYKVTGKLYRLWSCGPDGISGTPDDIEGLKN
jgi:prepilin-type N-terminal cleavage/methylation domain-containing protein